MVEVIGQKSKAPCQKHGANFCLQSQTLEQTGNCRAITPLCDSVPFEVKDKKVGSRNTGSLVNARNATSEAEAHSEAHIARELVGVRLAIPTALDHWCDRPTRTGSSRTTSRGGSSPVDPLLRVVPALQGLVQKRSVGEAYSTYLPGSVWLAIPRMQ